jgi:gamma-glutamylcyclotransferase (GGCT)/AIG2-like uncharacterized protein YtfP
MTDFFYLFVYGTLRSGRSAANLLKDSRKAGEGSVGGVLYDIDGEYPALIVYGNTPVPGEVWQCPVSLLRELDAYEQVETGLFRRIAMEVQMTDGSVLPCWGYVAGPRLAAKLTPARRVDSWGVTIA